MIAAVLLAALSADTWNFLAIGDWGNDSPGQHAAAVGMGTVAAEINATQVYAPSPLFPPHLPISSSCSLHLVG